MSIENVLCNTRCAARKRYRYKLDIQLMLAANIGCVRKIDTTNGYRSCCAHSVLKLAIALALCKGSEVYLFQQKFFVTLIILAMQDTEEWLILAFLLGVNAKCWLFFLYTCIE